MKALPYVLIVLLAAFVIYKLINPDVEYKEKLTPGKPVHDTTIVVHDSIVYVDRWHNGTVDTVYLDTLGFVHASDWFNIQNLVSGVVWFDQSKPEFLFTDVEIKQKTMIQTITTERVDTLKITKTITSGFHHGITAGFGYGLINKEFDVFVGYGVSFEF